MSNAKRYGGPETWIDPASNDAQSILTVSDNGSGIPKDLQRNIFHPYVRGGGARRPQQAIGLGLTVSRDLAQLMGGDLQYVRIADATEFRLTLLAASSNEPVTVEPKYSTVEPARR